MKKEYQRGNPLYGLLFIEFEATRPGPINKKNNATKGFENFQNQYNVDGRCRHCRWIYVMDSCCFVEESGLVYFVFGSRTESGSDL